MAVLAVLLKILAVFALVFLNAFFVAGEFALVKVRTSQIDALALQGSRRARSARSILGSLDTSLSACQLGITMTSLGLGWVGEPFVADLLRPLLEGLASVQPTVTHAISFGIAFASITFLHIVLGEQAPKWYAIQRSQGTALTVARPLALFTTLFRPVIWFVNTSSHWFLRRAGVVTTGEAEAGHSAEELRLLLSSGEAITALGRRISLRALDLRERNVREVMVPRTDVVYLSLQRSIEANVSAALENQYTRYPLCERDLDSVVGMIHLKDLFKLKGETGPGERLLSIRRDMPFVPETTSLERMLSLFLGRRVLMAIAVDEYGGTAGLVTLENVLEELVGEIRDEFDVEGAMVRRDPDGSMVVEGGMPLHEFASTFGVQADSKDVVTVSGYVIERLGQVPRPGTTVELGAWRGTVGAVEAGRILTIRLRRAESE